MQVVYVDVLFFINFCMDLLALRCAGAILHLPAGRFRLSLASAIGGGYAVASALYPGGAVLSAAIGIGVAGLLCYVAYGGLCKRGRLLAVFALFFCKFSGKLSRRDLFHARTYGCILREQPDAGRMGSGF